MDLTRYLLSQIVLATRRKDETEAEALERKAAIEAMFHSYDPAPGIETTIAYECVLGFFIQIDATRDLFQAEPDSPARHRALTRVTGASRAVHQWITKLLLVKKTAQIQAAEASPAIRSATCRQALRRT